MANPEHLNIIKQGVNAWNQWRAKNPRIKPDLSRAELQRAGLTGVDFREADLTLADLSSAVLTKGNFHKANLRRANLRRATLLEADLGEADLTGADLSRANISRASFYGSNLNVAALVETIAHETNFSYSDLTSATLIRARLGEANLKKANLQKTNLRKADLSNGNFEGAILCDADLSEAILIEPNFEDAYISGCLVYGTSSWNLKINEETKQSNLIITRSGEAVITVDNLEVAQFIYLLLHNKNIRHIIDTITTKVVLILGRFTPERKAVLNAIREELRGRDYIPVLFDFDKPEAKDTHETITTLARLARFVVADITDPKSIPQELV